MRAKLTGHALRFAVVMAVATCLGSAAMGQGPAAEQGATRPAKVSKALPARSSSAAPKPQGGQQEGIKVHGDWTIVIRNADGSVASRHEFKNALVDFSVLPLLLAHGGSVGQWSVTVSGPHPMTQPCQGAGLPIHCVSVESPSGGTLSVTNSATNLTLVGSVKAQVSSPLASVETRFAVCNSAQGPSLICQASVFSTFTRKDISAQNIQVAAGQTIDVTVVISFS